MSNNNKDELLKNLYYHELGYQSISHLFKEANKIDGNITLAYVKDWYNYFNERKHNYEDKTVILLHNRIGSIRSTSSFYLNNLPQTSD